jgi:hypothetical protein
MSNYYDEVCEYSYYTPVTENFVMTQNEIDEQKNRLNLYCIDQQKIYINECKENCKIDDLTCNCIEKSNIKKKSCFDNYWKKLSLIQENKYDNTVDSP